MPALRIPQLAYLYEGAGATFDLSLLRAFDRVRQCDQIRGCVLVQVNQLSRFESLGVPHFKRRARPVQVKLLTVTSYRKSECRTSVEVLLVDHFVALDVPNPPLGRAVCARSDFRHNRVASLAIRRKLESIHR